ncbi:MAG TPA: cupin domain-containing protein [Vicinamibacterales bacterium]|nr:cupin domain-containing protein [Vicinamibacterales bacterium]
MRFIVFGILSLALVQQQRPAPSCGDAEHRQFDFWIGDWEVLAPNGTVAGHSRITPASMGCAIEEQWSGAGGGNGRSLNTYDPNDKKWHQYWVGGDGTILQLAGTFGDNAMTLGDGTNRIRWSRNSDGSVRQTWDVTKDSGKTWQTTFDGKYVRSTAGEKYRAPSGLALRLLVDDTAGDSSVSMGEMTFPPNLDSGDHQHGSIEMFYVISGELEHIVNGQSKKLTPGMTGFVNPPDKVRHKTGTAGATAIVVWVPAQEAKRIVSRWTKEP